MACVENISASNAESEMEEGEIVDELDDLSDISSEEEFLLRQRLQVLENYNNVLERKKAKHSTGSGGVKYKRLYSPLPDLSEISATELEENYHTTHKSIKEQKHVKAHNKQRKKKVLMAHENISRNKDHKKKTHRGKKKLQVKIISESSDESEDEYRNKRRKLANAVVVNKNKSDKSSLSARLKKMLYRSEDEIPVKLVFSDQITKENNIGDNDVVFSPVSSTNADDPVFDSEINDKVITEEVIENSSTVCELIDLCTDDDVHIISSEPRKEYDKFVKDKGKDTVDSVKDVENRVIVKCMKPDNEGNKSSERDSDEDLELLRQHALKTKPTKTQVSEKDSSMEQENKILSEDEDSDTAELRLICLKSALLKKAIEMKQKQKLQKRLSQSSNLNDDFLIEQDMFPNKIDSENNTDIESVDMDIGSDGEEKMMEWQDTSHKDMNSEQNQNLEKNVNITKITPITIGPKDDELDEDEDLLRAKLLTSLSKNLPNLINPAIMANIEKVSIHSGSKSKNQVTDMPEEKKFIIQLGESDSEAEHEATKNLTKMHMKLSEQLDFQQKLDMFLKSTRMEVEKTTLPDVVQKPLVPKNPEKFVAKAVKHLPKSEQIEYKNLVKRMAELEKIKQSRQSSIIKMNIAPAQVKETLKPRNVSVDSSKLVVINHLEEQIAISRKKIAEESAKMLRLKEEATKLSQKYKIVATELRNITTAITLNKKQQRSVQNCLTKIRVHHQTLLKSSTVSKHSKVNGHMASFNHLSNKIMPATRLQKENDPSKEEYKNPLILKTVKVSVVNDFKDEEKTPSAKLSVQVDVVNNKKVVKIPKSPVNDRIVDINNDKLDTADVENVKTCEDPFNSIAEDKRDTSQPVVEKGGGKEKYMEDRDQESKIHSHSTDDYKSPLQALGVTNWEADPNAILCPFEVGGECKDPDCKYLHTNIPNQ